MAEYKIYELEYYSKLLYIVQCHTYLAGYYTRDMQYVSGSKFVF